MKNLYLFISFSLLFALNNVMAQTVFYEIANEHIVAHPTLGSATSFDVMMSADQTGTFHSRGQIYFNYNASRFGTTVNLSNNIAYVPGPLLNEQLNFGGQFYNKYSTINVADNKETVVVFTWLSNFLNALPSPSIHTAVPTTPTLLYTIFLKNQNAAVPSGITLATQNMIGQQFYLTNVGGTATEIPYANGFLPVELLDFHADKLDGRRVELNWATATELNNDHFVIEKSFKDGSFFPLGKVKGAGTTDEVQTYQFLDASSMDAVNYYRLKQVDIDGSVKYSNVVNVHFDLNQMVVYPSPSNGTVFVKYMGEITGDAKIKVTDMSGKLIMATQHHFAASNETMTLDFSSFADGMYMVQLTRPSGSVETHRVVKLKK